MPNLTGGRIVLRPVLEGDGEAIVESVRSSLAELEPWMPWAHRDYNATDTLEWIAKVSADPDNHQFAALGEGRHVGNAGIWNADKGNGEVGYWIRSDATGRGLATRAARLLIRHGFEDLAFDRVLIRTDPANVASQRVAEKAGGRRLPELHRHEHADGSLHELMVFVDRRDALTA